MESIDLLMIKIGALRQVQEAVAEELKAEIRADVVAIFSQKTKPTVAWMTEDGRVAHASTKECMPGVSQESYCIPLAINL